MVGQVFVVWEGRVGESTKRRGARGSVEGGNGRSAMERSGWKEFVKEHGTGRRARKRSEK